MNTKKAAAEATTLLHDTTKVAIYTEKHKVYAYFLKHVGTTLDCAFATGILRNSITYYVADLEEEGLLRWIKKGADPTTNHKAKFYSANQDLWAESEKRNGLQLILF